MKKVFWNTILTRLQAIFDRDPLKIEPNPKRDWTIIFILFCLAVIGSGLGHFLAYKHFLVVSTREPVAKSQPTKTLSKDDLMKVINRYEARKAEFDTLLLRRPEYVDPSK